MALLLKGMGHEVDFAINGTAALQVARRFRPDFVILDLGLPDGDGTEVARQLRKEPGLETAQIVSVTGRSLTDDRRRSLEAGCNDHFLKPLDPVLLVSLLEAA
jgi:two-component system CheB/CheR fusion protein